MILDKLIISVEDLKMFRPVAEQIKVDRIEPFIRECQRHDLRPILGDALYFDFMKKFDDESQGVTYTNYQLLLQGDEYTYGGVQVQYDGLIPLLSYLTLARFIPSNQMNISSFGTVKKKTDQSEPMDKIEIAAEVASLRSVAILYQDQLTQYLVINQAKFPLYPQQQSEGMNKIGAKFFDPDNNDYPANKSSMYPYNVR